MMPATFFLLWTSLLCVDSLRAVIATSGAGGAPATARCAAPFDAPPVDSIDELLGGNVDLLDSAQRSLVESLLRVGGQRSLFEAWPAKGSEDASKMELVASLQKVDASYEGGLAAYVSKARVLLDESASGANPFSGYTAEVPDGETLAYGSAAFDAAEARGLDAAQNVGFVLVAGGLGERLGYEGIKLELPVDAATGRSFLQLYCDYILALQARVRMATGDAQRMVPLAIMTSDDTDAPTRELLLQNGNFGLQLPGQLTIIKQDKVAALADGTAKLATKGKWELLTKPHGHGDVHALMRTSGVARKWAAAGLEHAFFFQDTNALVLNSVLAALGVSVARGFAMNSVCIPRRAGELAGAISRLRSDDADKPELVINVEYNQLDPLLRAQSTNGEGDVNDPATGFSPYPGNANVLVLALEDYVSVLDGADKGVVDEFVNPKYADAAKCAFKKPTRLECMMQDYPKLLKRERPQAAVGFTTFERWLAFSPAKNDVASARALAAKDEPPGCSASAEFDVYAAHARRLGLAASTAEVEVAGVRSLWGGPRAVLAPSFALSAAELRGKVANLAIADGALLVVSGARVELRDVSVRTGALFVANDCDDATLVVRDLVVDNGGVNFVDIPDDELAACGPVERVRGYRAVFSGDVLRVEITAPGHYELTSEGLKKVADTMRAEL